LRAAALSVGVFLLAAAPSLAQAPPSAPPPPLPGFMPPYEVTRIVRSAGFDPLAPPLREGTTYVLRATDFRGILMRVVVDARSGAIRAVNRIVPGPAAYGPVGMMPPPYGAPPPYGEPAPYGVPSPYGPPPPYGARYGTPPGLDAPEMGPQEADLGTLPPPPPEFRPGTHPLGADVPPLPRPRPAELSRDAKGDVRGNGKPGDKPAETPPPTKPEATPNAAVVAPPAPPAAPAATRPASAAPKKPLPPAIPD
jgi:hypothetical protein